MGEGEILIWELVSVNGKGSRSVCIEKVSSLGYEAVDDAVEDGILVAHGLVVHAVRADA